MEPKKNECSAEAVGQPHFYGIPPGEVLYQSGDSFKRYMDDHIETLIQKMISEKIISKKFGKAIKGQHNSLDMLLATMKKMSLEKFVKYLRLLLTISKSEEPVVKKGAETVAENLEDVKTIQDSAKNLMGLMKGSLEAMKPAPGSDIHAVITDLVHFVFQDGRVQSQTELQQLDAPNLSQPFQPPEGDLGNPESGVFTNEGGALYSALHGVTVTIPPKAIPGAIPNFYLSIHFYLQQPFTLMDDADPCSVIVWIYQDPRFHFLEDVTVKIPHASVVDGSLCVLTWGKDKQLNLNTEVPADFSDGYHAVIKVKHFCPKVAARRNPIRKCTKKPGSSKNMKKMENLKNGSLETSIEEGLVSLTNSTEAVNIRPLPRQDAISMECDSPAVPVSQDSLTAEEDESGFKYSIACSMPSDRSTGDWKVQFAACQSNPTGILLLWQLAEKLFCKNFYLCRVDYVRIRGGSFEMCPETWSDNIWKIDASEKKPYASTKIFEKQILSASCKAKLPGQVFHNPPRLCYDVYHLSENVHSKLHCWMYAQRARTDNGCTPCFIITSTTKNGDRVLFTSPYLYAIDSDIIKLLNHQGQNIILDTLTSEHLKFLADISLQLPDTQRLCEALNIGYRPNEKEDTFTILGNWVASQGGDASLIRLKKQLRTVDIVDIAVCENKDSSVLLSPHLEHCLILDIFTKDRSAPSYKALLDLSGKLEHCWKDVGRLLGIAPNELEKIVLQEKSFNIIDPPSYQLIFNWQRREGKGATFGALFKAIHRVFHHQPLLINDAHLFCVHYVHEHLPIHAVH